MAGEYVATMVDGRKSRPASEAEILRMYVAGKIPDQCIITNTVSGVTWTAAEFFADNASNADKKRFKAQSVEPEGTDSGDTPSNDEVVSTNDWGDPPGSTHDVFSIFAMIFGVVMIVASFFGFLAFAMASANNSARPDVSIVFQGVFAGLLLIGISRTYDAIQHQRALMLWQCELQKRIADK